MRVQKHFYMSRQQSNDSGTKRALFCNAQKCTDGHGKTLRK